MDILVSARKTKVSHFWHRYPRCKRWQPKLALPPPTPVGRCVMIGGASHAAFGGVNSSRAHLFNRIAIGYRCIHTHPRLLGTVPIITHDPAQVGSRWASLGCKGLRL